MTKCVRFVLAVTVATTLHLTAASQSVGINTTGAVADPSAMLDVTSTTKGVLIPRMTKAQKTAIAAPATGLLIFQNAPDSTGFYYYNGTAWVWLSDATNADTTAWKITGNNNITAARFLGTTNDSTLHFRVNNQPSGRIDSINLNTGFGYGTLRHLNYSGGLAGKTNSAFGYRAMDSTTTGFYNNAFGYNAMLSNKNGWDNSAFGNEAMKANTSGTANTAFGAGTLFLNTTGTYNTAIGWIAGFNNTTAWHNTVLGAGALRTNATTDGNTAVGVNALMDHRTNPFNTAIGFEALQYDTSGWLNTAVGWRSMWKNLKGQENTAIGVGSLEQDTSGNWNTAVGRYAGFGPKSGNSNIWMGFQSGLAADTADLTTNIGTFSGYYNKMDYSTAIGAYSLTFNSQTATNNLQGAENTGLGYGSGYAINLGAKNTAVGFQSMNGGGFYVNGSRNSGVGDSSLFRLTNGNDNVAMGYRALAFATNSSQNVAVGSRALINFSGSYPNTAIGYSSMDSTTTGAANTAVGSYSFTANKTGINNVAVGNAAMYESTLGNNNTAVGNDAGRLISANQNTAIGSAALRNDSTGIDNVAVGYQASFSADTASLTTAIGRGALTYNLRSENTAVGSYAGRLGNFNPATTSLHPTRNTENTAIGFRSMNSNGSGRKNVAVGYRAFAIAGDNSYTYEVGSGPAILLSRNVAIGDSAMAVYTGSSGVAIGADAMSRAGFVFNNVAIGDSAMGNASTTAANDNVAIGYKSLSQVRNQGNTATGAYSARLLTTGYWNTANGYFALDNATTAAGNTVMGTSSFRSNISGFDNVGVGINTGYHVTSGNNTYVGSYAGEGAAGFSTGGSNTGIGNFALSDIRSGSNNTAVGRDALAADSSGTGNVAIGRYAMVTNLASDYNTAVGYNSLYSHKRVGLTYNTGLGSFALEQDSSGSLNTGVGTSAFRINKTGYVNTGVGINAGYYQKKNDNTFIGGFSGVGERLPGNNYAVDTGSANTGVGAYSLNRVANGSNNVAMGYAAMYKDSSGNLNTAVGNGALYSNTGSHMNQAFGWNALYSYDGGSIDGWNNAFGDLAGVNLVTGTNNVMVGSWAMYSHTSGTYNTAVGNYVFGNGTGGSFNTAMGQAALWNTSADYNVGIGINAGFTNTSGTNNTLLGSNSDVTTSGLTNATAIGYNSRVAASNSLVLGQSGTNVGINETSPNARLHIVRSGTSGGAYHASSAAIIEDNTTSYLQFSNPNGNETGLLSGNASTTIRSGMIFRADSSIQFRSGGNTTTMVIDNTNFVGIANTSPADLLHVGTTTGARIRIGSLESLEDFGSNIIAINSNFYPTTDGVRNLGAAANRWNTVYATVGAINTSDARDKENITDLNYGLKEVMKLRPVSFNWKDNPQWGKKIGFIAQEVQPVLSEVVQVGDLKTKAPLTDADGTNVKAASDKLGIYYSDIIPVTVKAIQEQQQTIEQQQQQIQQLKKKNEQLERDMQTIKTKLGINN